jgi:CBS domain-containing protein
MAELMGTVMAGPQRPTEQATRRGPPSRANLPQITASAQTERCPFRPSDAAFTLDFELSVSAALSQLALTELTSAPVVDDNHVLVGLVTTSALLLLSDDDEADVEDAMAMSVVSAVEGATVAEVARLLAEHGLERLPITDAAGHLVGVVTALDLLEWFSARL